MSELQPTLTTKMDPLHLAGLLLREGRFAEGWKLYETRPSRVVFDGFGHLPEWQGEDVKHLLVIGEQGLGDQLQFVRYLRQARARVAHVALLVFPPLARLFRPLVDDLVVMAPGVRVPTPQAWVFIGSLPRIFGADLSNISGAPYLPANPSGDGIGFMARGNPKHANDRIRSLPDDVAAEILTWPGVRSLAPEHTGAEDVEATRQIVDSLAAVVSVDTAIAHLAGAMGKPCFVLLPHTADWRWLTGRSDSPWYDSVRLFRQIDSGDWRGPVASVKVALGIRP